MFLEHKYSISLSGFVKKNHAENPTKQLKSVTKVVKEGSTVSCTVCRSAIGSFLIFFYPEKTKKKKLRNPKKQFSDNHALYF